MQAPGRDRDRKDAKSSEIMRRQDQLASQRIFYQHEWQEVADFFLPQQGRFRSSSGGGWRALDKTLRDMPASREPRAVRRRHDSTAIYALDRLGAGMDGLLTPQNETWQTLVLNDPQGTEPTYDEKVWLDNLLRYLFRVRYNPTSGFTASNPKAIRSACAFGVGIMYLEDTTTSSGRRDNTSSPIIYQHVPLSSCYLGCDAYDNVDTVHRRRGYSAVQLAKRWGEEALSEKVRAMLKNASQMDQTVEVMHAVYPRTDFDWKMSPSTVRNSAFESVWIEVETKHVIAAGGFYEFPYVVSHWQQGEESPYGDSPAMVALDDVRGLNIMRKALLRSAQQFVDPPLAVNHEGMLNRPSLNPGSITPGAIDANGRPKIQPILTGTNPLTGNQILEAERQSIMSALYADLFQMLAQQRPGETATAVLIRAEEKSNLLGPNGANISASHVRMTDRELGILGRFGLYNPGSFLAPPDSLRGRPFMAKSSTPLDQLREGKKVQAGLQVVQVHSSFAQAAGLPGGDRFDLDQILEDTIAITGAPPKWLISREAANQAREEQKEAMAKQQQLAAAESMAKTAKDAAPAIETLNNMGAGGGQGGPPPDPANDDQAASEGMLSAFAQ